MRRSGTGWRDECAVVLLGWCLRRQLKSSQASNSEWRDREAHPTFRVAGQTPRCDSGVMSKGAGSDCEWAVSPHGARGRECAGLSGGTAPAPTMSSIDQGGGIHFIFGGRPMFKLGALRFALCALRSHALTGMPQSTPFRVSRPVQARNTDSSALRQVRPNEARVSPACAKIVRRFREGVGAGGFYCLARG